MNPGGRSVLFCFSLKGKMKGTSDITLSRPHADQNIKGFTASILFLNNILLIVLFHLYIQDYILYFNQILYFMQTS